MILQQVHVAHIAAVGARNVRERVGLKNKLAHPAITGQSVTYFNGVRKLCLSGKFLNAYELQEALAEAHHFGAELRVQRQNVTQTPALLSKLLTRI